MSKLINLASILRSKNAGPLYLTFDIIFNDKSTYTKVKESGMITPGNIAKIYETDPNKVEIYMYDIVDSIKITIPRKTVCGALDDNDIYGCQQHLLLANIEIDG